MSVAPLNGPVSYVRRGPYLLARFETMLAPVVATWARDPQELFWLAPSTAAPLTAAKVVAWPGSSGGPRLLRRDDQFEPLGYCELNPMPAQAGHFWLGHCVIRPEQRSQGLGRMMLDMVLEEAFDYREAYRVSLMVFPDNLPAFRCYVSAGFRETGEQHKYFATTGKRYRMTQMSISRDRFDLGRGRRRAGGAKPAQ